MFGIIVTLIVGLVVGFALGAHFADRIDGWFDP